MRDLEKEIDHLRGMISSTRSQFLAAEVQSCYIALDLAETELARRRWDVAEKEIAAIDKAIRVIERFSPETPASHRKELENRLCDIKGKLNSLKARASSHT